VSTVAKGFRGQAAAPKQASEPRVPRPRDLRRAQRNRAVLRAVGWLALLLGAMALVVWRQTRGVELQREIRALDGERALADAERLELATRIQALQSRARVVQVARDRLGMHLPADSEVVMVPLPPEAPGAADSASSVLEVKR